MGIMVSFSVDNVHPTTGGLSWSSYGSVASCVNGATSWRWRWPTWPRILDSLSEYVKGEEKAKGGWLKKKALRLLSRNGGVFVFFVLVRFGGWRFLCFFFNSGWCFRDKPSTASSRSALLETTGTGSRTQGKSLSNNLLKIKCCFISVDESFFFLDFQVEMLHDFLGFNSTSCMFASYLASFVFSNPRLFSQLLREREDRLAFQHQVRNQDAAGWSPWWMEKVYTYYVDRFALAKILVVFINDIWLVP